MNRASHNIAMSKKWLTDEPDRWVHNGGEQKFDPTTGKYYWLTACIITSFDAAGIDYTSDTADGLPYIRTAIADLHSDVRKNESGEAMIVHFNDDPDRKFEEVLAVFDRAIELALDAERAELRAAE